MVISHKQNNNGIPFKSYSFAKRNIPRDDCEKKPETSDEIKALLKNLNKKANENKNTYSATSINKEKGYLDLSETTEKNKAKKAKQVTHYNYKDVSNKIRWAKTSFSAEQAVISAKRKVIEIKRKIACGNGDSEELQLALTHAKRMEMVARKKKHHLELEELVETTNDHDESLSNDSRKTHGVSESNDTQAAQEEIAKKEDAIFDERQHMSEESNKAISEQSYRNLSDNDSAPYTDEMVADLNSMIAEFGEEELKKLEEEMEQLEELEVVSPHMSDADLKKLKTKHRNAENKALIKADMDYLKGIIKHTILKDNTIPDTSCNSRFSAVAEPSLLMDVNIGTDAAIPNTEPSSVDIQI